MGVTVQTQANTNFVEVLLSKKITRQDYELFQPIIDAEIKKHGRICMLVIAKNFDGWDLGASWDETRFIFSHYSKIDRIGLVGAAEWQKWLTFFCKPFTSAEVKFFNLAQEDEARQWVTSAEIIYVDPKSGATGATGETHTTTLDDNGKKIEQTTRVCEADSERSASESSCCKTSANAATHTASGGTGKTADDSAKRTCSCHGSGKDDDSDIQEEEYMYSELDSDEPLLEDDEDDKRGSRSKNREEELVGAK